MLVQIISQYLESHKRLVIPQLGSFIVKEPGVSVVFSELLKRDDGTLRGLLTAQGATEVEAAGEIDRFVFEVRHAITHGELFQLADFGYFRGGANSTISFVYEPQPRAAAEGEEERAAASKVCEPEKIAEAMRHAFDAPRMSPSAKMNPDPSVRGLRYGRPHKTTDAYTYVDRPPRHRTDRFIWIAIIAAAIAIAAVAFGLFRSASEQRAESEPTEWVEPTQQTDTLNTQQPAQ